MNNIILGIDPGFADTGFGIIEENSNNLKCLDYGSIKTSPKIDFEDRLLKIYKELNKIIKKYNPVLVSIEKIFFYKNTKTAINVAQARGVMLLTAKKHNINIIEFTPLQIKQAVSSYGGASKMQIQKMVTLLLNLKEIPQPDDAADALAVAICAVNFL